MIESVKTMVKHTLCLLACALLMSFPAYAQKLPDAGGSMIVSAVSHYNEGNIKKASEILKTLLASDSSNDAAWYWSALVSMNINDASKAEMQLRKACELDPMNFWYRYRLAGLYKATSRQELTVDMYEKLLEDFHARLLRLVGFRLPLLLRDFESLDTFVGLDGFALAFETLGSLDTE